MKKNSISNVLSSILFFALLLVIIGFVYMNSNGFKQEFKVFYVSIDGERLSQSNTDLVFELEKEYRFDLTDENFSDQINYSVKIVPNMDNDFDLSIDGSPLKWSDIADLTPKVNDLDSSFLLTTYGKCFTLYFPKEFTLTNLVSSLSQNQNCEINYENLDFDKFYLTLIISNEDNSVNHEIDFRVMQFASISINVETRFIDENGNVLAFPSSAVRFDSLPSDLKSIGDSSMLSYTFDLGFKVYDFSCKSLNHNVTSLPFVINKELNGYRFTYLTPNFFGFEEVFKFTLYVTSENVSASDKDDFIIISIKAEDSEYEEFISFEPTSNILSNECRSIEFYIKNDFGYNLYFFSLDGLSINYSENTSILSIELTNNSLFESEEKIIYIYYTFVS